MKAVIAALLFGVALVLPMSSLGHDAARTIKTVVAV